MFRAHRAHHQERQIVSIQPLVTVTVCSVQVGSELRPAHDTELHIKKWWQLQIKKWWQNYELRTDDITQIKKW